MSARKSRRQARSPEVIAEIVALRAAGKHQKVIADIVGVSQAHVCKVIARERGAR